MSRNPQYMDVDEEVLVEKPVYYNAYGYTRGAWLAVACFGIFLVVVILIAVLWPYTVTTTQSNAMHIQSLNERLAAQHRSDFETEGMYSLARAFHTRQPHTLALCHLGMYRVASVGGTTGDTLRPVQDVGSHLGEHKGDAQYYVVKAHFNMQFNVDALTLSGVAARKLQAQLEVYDERYELVHYEMASSFIDFSTVKLVESELDTHKNALKIKREFIACSNNPALNVKRCRNLVDGLLVMNNTRLVTMDNPLYDNKKKHAPATPNATVGGTGRTTTTNTVKSGVKQTSELESEQGIDLTPEVKESLKALKSEITHLRMYHIMFYRAEKGRDASGDNYKENLILTVEPNKC